MFRRIEVKGFNSDLYETSQVFFSGKDGARIPMFIVHKKVSNTTSLTTVVPL